MEVRIKELRKERGLTLEELAEKAGMSVSFLSMIENGKRNVNAARLDALARALNVRIPELLRDGALSPALAEHLRIISELPLDDQRSIFRHAMGLSLEQEEPDNVEIDAPVEVGEQEPSVAAKAFVSSGNKYPYAAIGARVRRLRDHLGYASMDFAHLHGWGPTQLVNWETGHRRITIEAATILRERYGVSLDWVYLGVEGSLPQHLIKPLALKSKA
jgi:transcriptional regulator with XRE-family HTH domain